MREAMLFDCADLGSGSIRLIAEGVGLFDARLGVPTLICGPGSMAQGRKPDEYVSVEQMGRCQAMLAALVERLVAGI